MTTKTTEMPLKAEITSLKVRAFAPGYYGHGLRGQVYRNAGDVFTITPRTIPMLNKQGQAELDPQTGRLKTTTISVHDQFSANWMEAVSDDEPERLTTAKDEIARQIAELNSRGGPMTAE